MFGFSPGYATSYGGRGYGMAAMPAAQAQMPAPVASAAAPPPQMQAWNPAWTPGAGSAPYAPPWPTMPAGQHPQPAPWAMSPWQTQGMPGQPQLSQSPAPPAQPSQPPAPPAPAPQLAPYLPAGTSAGIPNFNPAVPGGGMYPLGQSQSGSLGGGGSGGDFFLGPAGELYANQGAARAAQRTARRAAVDPENPLFPAPRNRYADALGGPLRTGGMLGGIFGRSRFG